MINFTTNKPEKEKEYFQRTGAYGIICNNQGLLAIIKNDLGYFLLGGGVEGKESFEDCICRECLEEVGMKVKVIKKIACGNSFLYSTRLQTDVEVIGHFYVCKMETILEDIETEEDHELIWVTPEKALEVLYLDNQKKAIEISCSIK